MPKIEKWANLPPAVRQRLIDRMRDRAIGIPDLNRLRLWIDSNPEVPEGDWYKDFGSFKICGAAPHSSQYQPKSSTWAVTTHCPNRINQLRI